MTIIKFPRGIEIDLENIPDDFEEQIRESFKGYTEDTRKEYMYQDKLSYIDLIRKYVHKARNEEDCVMELMKDRFEYEISENGIFLNEYEFLSIEFMRDCFNAGRTDLYSHYEEIYSPSHYIGHISEIVQKLLYKAIKVVMDYESEENERD